MSEQAKTREYYRDAAPFAADQAEKDAFFRKELKILTDYHRKSCAAYDDICNGLGEDGPYIPVALFKDLALASVPEEEVVRQVTSSGTTGQQVSRIFLDAAARSRRPFSSRPRMIFSVAVKTSTSLKC